MTHQLIGAKDHRKSAGKRGTPKQKTRLFAIIAASCCVLWAPSFVLAHDPPTGPSEEVYRIEEDWELIVLEPAAEIHSPQITLFTTPMGHSFSKYFQYQLNHVADEGFSGGGFQVAAVVDEHSVDRADSGHGTPLTVNGDVIRWTLVMANIDDEFLFAVKNGTSASWGTFGGREYLVRMPAGGVVGLPNYDYQASVDSVDVGFGGNRVSALRLRKVRYYDRYGRFGEIIVSSDQ